MSDDKISKLVSEILQSACEPSDELAMEAFIEEDVELSRKIKRALRDNVCATINRHAVHGASLLSRFYIISGAFEAALTMATGVGMVLNDEARLMDVSPSEHEAITGKIIDSIRHEDIIYTAIFMACGERTSPDSPSKVEGFERIEHAQSVFQKIYGRRYEGPMGRCDCPKCTAERKAKGRTK